MYSTYRCKVQVELTGIGVGTGVHHREHAWSRVLQNEVLVTKCGFPRTVPGVGLVAVLIKRALASRPIVILMCQTTENEACGCRPCVKSVVHCTQTYHKVPRLAKPVSHHAMERTATKPPRALAFRLQCFFGDTSQQQRSCVPMRILPSLPRQRVLRLPRAQPSEILRRLWHDIGTQLDVRMSVLTSSASGGGRACYCQTR